MQELIERLMFMKAQTLSCVWVFVCNVLVQCVEFVFVHMCLCVCVCVCAFVCFCVYLVEDRHREREKKAGRPSG